jgi:hypothetical protein
MFISTQMSCTKDFAELNTSPTAIPPDQFDPNFLLTNAENGYKNAISGYNGPILFQSGWVQLLASTTTEGAIYYSNMDKYVPSANTQSYSNGSWGSGYGAGANAQKIIELFGDDASRGNSVGAATVIKVMAVSYLADVYGDVPYTEAFKNETEGIQKPIFDKQDVAMKAMLADLEKASAMFGAGKAPMTSDVMYNGDWVKWKKLANSVMLRIAMRYTKRDPAFAKTWAEKAIAGGVFTSSTDDAFMPGDQANGYTNSNAGALRVIADLYEVRWSKTFIDFLKSTNDPRISAIAEVPPNGRLANINGELSGDATAAVQIGLPNGYDMNGGALDITNSPGYPGPTGTGGDVTKIGKYSRPKGHFRNLNAPVYLMTYAEVALLQAEAKVRGWAAGSATAAELYANGVKAGMASLARFGATAVVSAAEADAYVAANPLNVSSTAASLRMINEQYWATTGSYMNFTEAWSNWRRTGFPVLTPVVVSGNFGNNQIPRRQMYNVESGLNLNNLNSAISTGLTPGVDAFSSRVWWDQ